jgi:hypothetical protein
MLIATGPLRIYRVSNTGVSFLNSGEFLRPILQKSQAWCVDESKAWAIFVLRSREDSFYRIELPRSTPEENKQTEEFKLTLGTVLRYEKTPCPFRDGFEESLEEYPPATPLRRRSTHGSAKAKKWKLNKIWEPEDGVWIVPTSASPAKSESSTGDASPMKYLLFDEKRGKASLLSRRGVERLQAIAGAERTSSESPEKRSPGSPRSAVPLRKLRAPEDVFGSHVSHGESSKSPLKTATMSLPPQHLRSVTSPPTLLAPGANTLPSPSTSTRTSVYHSAPSERNSVSQHDPDTASLSSDVEFYSAAESVDGEDEDYSFILPDRNYRFLSVDGSSTTSTTASPPETPRPGTATFEDVATPRHSQSISTHASVSTTSVVSQTSSAQIDPDTEVRQRRPFKLPIMIEDTPSVPSTPPRQLLPTSCQPLSILSPTFPSPSKPLSGQTTVIQRACALLVGTPAHMLIAMLRIAFKILRKLPGGERVTDGLGLGKVPGAWDSEFEGDSDENASGLDDADDADDYGYPLRKGEGKKRDKGHGSVSKELEKDGRVYESDEAGVD